MLCLMWSVIFPTVNPGFSCLSGIEQSYCLLKGLSATQSLKDLHASLPIESEAMWKDNVSMVNNQPKTYPMWTACLNIININKNLTSGCVYIYIYT